MKSFFSPVASTVILCSLLLACQPTLYTVKKQVQYLPINDISVTDSAIEKAIYPYKEQIDTQMKRVIGKAVKLLYCNRQDIESPLGNFIVDLVFLQTSRIYDKPIDFALINNGGIRVPINEGEITVGNIFELMPFENEVMVVSIKGTDLHDLFAYEGQHRKTSFANARFEYTSEGQLLTVLIGGKPVEPEKIYHIATYDYLANGGDGMNCLALHPKEPMSIMLRTMIINHIEELTKQNKLIDANIEGRVIFK